MLSDLSSTIATVIVPWLLNHGIRIVLFILGGYLAEFLLTRLIIKVVRISVRPAPHDSPDAEKKREDTLIRIITWTSAIIVILLVAAMILQELGVSIGPILAGAGVVGLAVGFGGQYLIRDFITGFFLILENQYRIGDFVSLDGTEGNVEDISLRMTSLRDMNGTVHYVPHGDIKRVSNMSKNFARINLNINVTYHSNMEKVIRIINEVGNEISMDPAWKDLIIKAPQFLRVDDFTDSSVTLKIVGETMPNKQWTVTGELRKRILETFEREHIELPIPQRFIQHVDVSDSRGHNS